MTIWKSGAELSAVYAVSEQSLLRHARRGDLAMCRVDACAPVFDEGRVSRLFRRRSADARAVGFGALGVVRLAEANRHVVSRSGLVPRGDASEEHAAAVIPLAPRVPRLTG